LGILVKKQPLESSRRKQNNNFKIDLREMGCEGRRWVGTGSRSCLIADLVLVVVDFEFYYEGVSDFHLV
jgi:hypothetical protein